MALSQSLLFFTCLSVTTGTQSLELTSDSWEASTAGKTLFVKFFAPWCGHCKKIKPQWDQLTADFQGSPTALVAEVDCTSSGKTLCETLGVKGYPSLMWGTSDKLEVYTGDREYEGLKKFAAVNLGKSCGPGNLNLCDVSRRATLEVFMQISPTKLTSMVDGADKRAKRAEYDFKVVEYNMSQLIAAAEKQKADSIQSIKEGRGLSQGTPLTPANYDEQVRDKKVFIKFFIPQCGHCTAMKPAWEKLMSDYEGTLNTLVAEVDCIQHRPLCEKHDVTGFPRLLSGKGNIKKLNQYSGGRTYEELSEFAGQHLGKQCSPANLELCEGSRKALMEQNAKLSTEDYDAQNQIMDKAIEAAEQVFFDTQWNYTLNIDLAEMKKNELIKNITSEGLAEAKLVQAWNKKQPAGFWKPPAKPPVTNFEYLRPWRPSEASTPTKQPPGTNSLALVGSVVALIAVAIFVVYFIRINSSAKGPVNKKSKKAKENLQAKVKESRKQK